MDLKDLSPNFKKRQKPVRLLRNSRHWLKKMALNSPTMNWMLSAAGSLADLFVLVM